MMKFKDVQCYTQTGIKHNEDRGYGTSTYGWVIDGATGLRGVHITDGDSDAAWFAEAVHTEIKKRMETYSGSIQALLEEVSKVVSAKFYNYEGSRQLENDCLPSAGICMVRVQGDVLEYYTLGDCTLLIKMTGGKVKKVYDDRVSYFDQAGCKEMVALAKENNIDVLDARDLVNPTLIANRKMKNHPEGYYCFTIQNNKFSEGLSGRVPLAEIEAVAMMSDGYAQYYDTLHCVADEAAMMEAIRIKGLETIGTEIKEVQNEDSKANHYPRFKISDDMTIVYMNNSVSK